MKKYDQAVDSDSNLMTIQEILISKCLYYYEFEKIMGKSLNIALSYIAESGHPNYVTINKPLKNINVQKDKLFL